jgi:hypothetical protein
MLLDRIEKLGRIVLWLAISSACVIAPITYLKLQSAAAEMAEASRKADAEEAAKKAQAELDERSGKTQRLPLATMGTFLDSLGAAQGQIVFTNVSSRSGFLCVVGVARNRTTGKATSSIPACKAVSPYDSTVVLSMMFAGGEMGTVCPNSSCDLEVVDAPQAVDTEARPKSPTVAAAAPRTVPVTAP